jgi:uncharacterized protein YbbC (DUF1343 family)
MVSLEAAIAYAGTCLLEGSNLSEGRGTDAPFLQFGAPFIDGGALAAALSSLQLPGVNFEATRFTPAPHVGASNPRFNGLDCHGVRLRITDRDRFAPWRCGVEILRSLARLHGEKVRFTSYLNSLAGMTSIVSTTPHELLRREREETAKFSQLRKPYLLYR